DSENMLFSAPPKLERITFIRHSLLLALKSEHDKGLKVAADNCCFENNFDEDYNRNSRLELFAS
ncbi:hypothetical protein CEXT_458591, partial [Caerostris extrusa]